MATKQIGKLKLHVSGRGIAFKWGEGEIHRLSFQKKQPSEQENYEQQGGYEQQDAYDPGTGYDPAGPDYGGAGIGPEGGYDDGGSPYGDDGYLNEVPERYRFLYTNDYLMYALLVLLPPLGIWILWKKGMFSQTVRTVISAASAIWFVLLLIWLFSALFGGGNDVVTQPEVNNVLTATPVPVEAGTNSDSDITITATPAPTPKPGAASTDSTTGTGFDTPVTITDTTDDIQGNTGDANTNTNTDSSIVYATNNGMYYHKALSCSQIESGAEQVDISIARSRGQTKCPVCYGETEGGTTYYITSKGKYYHTDSTCGGMKNAQAVTLDAAVKAGKKVCPKCIGQYYATSTGKYYHTKKNCSGMTGAQRITKAAAVQAGQKPCPKCVSASKSSSSTSTASKTYYSTAKGKYYHVNKTCGGMKGATKVNATQIKNRKQTACPVCIGSQKASTANASTTYYAVKSGKYYHVKANCSGMKNASKVTLTTAKKYGLKACPVCLSASNSTSTANYYATASGKYYHKSKDCERLKDASGIKKVTKATATKYGKTACPTCLKDTATKVYATTGGKYYHKTSTCSGMKNAKGMTLASAKAKGKTACPTCFKSSVASGTYYYATANNKYYHTDKDCSGMINASKVTLSTAKEKGKTACPICVKKTATTYCYATASNKYYHKKANCSGMTGASKVTLSYAKAKGKTACPVCVKGSATPAPTNKVYCYASSGSKYYHKLKNCSGMLNAKKVLLTTAKAKGKTACPVCVLKKANATTSSADKRTVCYASSSNAYYHSNKACVDGLKKTTVYAAKEKGKTACPVCAGKSLTTYVYVSKDGTKYHRKSNCSGLTNAYKVSLNTAIKYNYTRCTKCNAPKAS